MSESSETVECVLCCKLIEIYAVGVCNHKVCYECITRMRVLCQQNECPICRCILVDVYLTSSNVQYESINVKTDIFDKDSEYKILFQTNEIKKKYSELMEIKCFKCQDRTFGNFDALQSHMRKTHNLFYCGLCIDNIKIFPKERKAYNRHDLGLHRRKGDSDFKAHRGHPICNFCDNRFFDKDALYKHLRTDHFYCHICDASGGNDFYSEISTLSDHFRKHHFVCEEESCVQDILTNVFKTEIDLKAHKAQQHRMEKYSARQMRNIDVELMPRQYFLEPEEDDEVRNTEPLDATDESQFPSLNNIKVQTYPGSSSNKTNAVPLSMRTGKGGLTMNNENFPQLQPTKSKPSTLSSFSAPPVKKTLSNHDTSAKRIAGHSIKFDSVVKNSRTQPSTRNQQSTNENFKIIPQPRQEAAPKKIYPTSIDIKSKNDFPSLSLRKKNPTPLATTTQKNGKIDKIQNNTNNKSIEVPQHKPLKDSAKRNKALKEQIAKLLSDGDSLKNFQEASKAFMESKCSTAKYVERCRVVLGNNFEQLFSELLALLPNIQKQHELFNFMKAGNAKYLKDTLGRLRKCKQCKQIMLVSDIESHQQQQH